MKIAIIGLGYVGLPLAILSARSGYEVVGIDIDRKKVDLINSGRSPVEDISDRDLNSVLSNGSLQVTANFLKISEAYIVVICVPTPLSENKKPDLSHLESAVKEFSKYLNKSTLVILESTVEPGTTRDYLVPLIKEYSNLTENEFDVSYSPERVDPLNKKWNLKNTPKLISGLNKNASNRTIDFYSKFIDNIFECDLLEIAELAKLLENSFRYVNISFINELSILCQKLDIDVNKVIAAASTKPYGFMPFYPSIGVGGHCIPVDPLYLSNKAREIGASTRFIDLADQINQEMPGYFVGRAEEKLGGLINKQVIVVGVSYKPNVADVRETPVSALINGLRSKGARVSWHDDLVKEWNGEKSVALSNDFDLAIITTPHNYLDLTKLGNVPILNTRGSI